MKMTSFALAMAAPAALVCAAEPETATTPDNELKEQITTQARVEMSMLTMQYPAPTDKDDPMAQISYVFELCHIANRALVQTAKDIVSKETADDLAVELGARREVYMGLCIAAAFSSMAGDKLTEEQQGQLTELAAVQNKEDSEMSEELHRLEQNDYYGSDQLKAVIKLLSSAAQGVQVETEEATTEDEETSSAELETLIDNEATKEKGKLAEQNPLKGDEGKMEQIGNLFKLCAASRDLILETALAITSEETAEAKALELGGRCQVYLELSFACMDAAKDPELSDAERKQVEEMAESQMEKDKAVALELRRVKVNAYYGSSYLKAVMDTFVKKAKAAATKK